MARTQTANHQLHLKVQIERSNCRATKESTAACRPERVWSSTGKKTFSMDPRPKTDMNTVFFFIGRSFLSAGLNLDLDFRRPPVIVV